MRRSVSRNGPVMKRSGPGAGVVPGTSRRWVKTYELVEIAYRPLRPETAPARAAVRDQLRSADSVRWPDQETSTSSSTEKASSATELGSQINAIPTARTGITSPA